MDGEMPTINTACHYFALDDDTVFLNDISYAIELTGKSVI